MNAPITTLVIANPEDKELLQALSDSLALVSWRFVVVQSAAEWRQKVSETAEYDLILLNVALAWERWASIMAACRTERSVTPLVIYALEPAPTAVAEALDAGAEDALLFAGATPAEMATFLTAAYKRVSTPQRRSGREQQIADVLSFVSAQLLTDDDFVTVLARVLPPVGQLVAADIAYILERHGEESAAGEQLISLDYRWRKDQADPLIGIGPAEWQNFDYRAHQLEGLIDRLADGETIFGHLDDFSEPDRGALKKVMETDFVLAAPIFCLGEWWGALMIEVWSAEVAWTTAEVQAVQTVANMLGNIIQSSSLLEAQTKQLEQARHISTVLRRQTDELAALYEISTSITGVLKPSDLLERLYVQIDSLMDADLVIAVLYDEDSEEIEVIVARERGVQLRNMPIGMRLSVHEGGLTGWMLRNRRTVILDDVQHDETPVPLRYIPSPTRGWLGTPLMVQGQVLGAISVQSFEAGAYDRDDMRFVEMVATQAAVAINSARIYQKERQRRQISEKLHGLTAQLNSSLEIRPILEQALETVRAILPDMSICIISFYDPAAETLTSQVIWSDEERYIFTPVGSSIPLAETQMAHTTIKEKRTVIVENMAAVEPKNDRARKMMEMGIGSLLYIPMILDEEPIGLLSINYWGRIRQFAAEEVALCEAATNHVVMAIKNARTYESEIKRRQEAELLQALSSYLIKMMSMEEVFEQTTNLLHDYLPDISYFRFLVLDQSGFYLIPTKGWRDPTLPPPLFNTDEKIDIRVTRNTRICIEEKRPVLIKELPELAEKNERVLTLVEMGLRSVLYLPLLLRDEVIGMLQVEVWRTPREFKQEEIALCAAVCNQVAIAIEKVKLIEAEREQLHLTQTLRDVGSLLTSDLTLEQVFERIFDLLAQVIAYDTVSIQLYDESIDRMRLAAGRGFTDYERTAEIVYQIGHRSLKLMGDKPFRVTKNVARDIDWIHFDNFDPIRSTISCALRVKDQVIGVLNIDSFTPNRYDEATAETALSFANQAVIAIENARLYDQLNQRAQELSILNQVAIMAAQVTSIDALLRATTEIIVESLFSRHFGFMLLDDSGHYLVPHPSYHIHSNPDLPYRVSVNSTLSGYVVQTKRPFWGNVRYDLPRYYRIDEATESELAVPLIVDDQVFGVINVEEGYPNAFSERELQFVQALADQLSVAIQRTQLYEESQFYAAQLEEKVIQRTAELQNERDRIRMILDNVGEGVLFTDAEAKIIYANPAIMAQSGYTSEELEGQHARLLNSPAHHDEEFFTELWAVLNEKRPWHGELVNVRKDGSLYEVMLTINPIVDDRGVISGYVSIQADITYLKEVERLKSEFVSNVSHELRTPLTNIKTFLTLLRRGREEKRERYQQVLEHEVDRLTRLIQDLLDLSRLDTNSVKTTLRPVALPSILRDCTANFTSKIENKHLQFTLVDTDDVPDVLADSKQLRLVIQNMMGNAADYTPEGGTIKIVTAAAEKEGQQMAGFHITNTGVGIPPEEIDKLFDRFFRGASSRSNQTPGTGLGLAISKEIIDRHNGLIEVSSEPEVETTFKVWLPVAD